MKSLKTSFNLYAINYATLFWIQKLVIFLSVVAYVAMGQPLTSKYVYVLGSLYDIIKTSSIFFSWGALCGGEMINSVKRIEQFLKSEQIGKTLNNTTHTGIAIDQIYVKRDDSFTLNDVTMKIAPNKLIAIVGSVGSGKTTLLSTILNEVPLYSGCIQIGGSISYASQEPWLFAGTVRENIIFGENFDQNKYEEVLKVCALERDLCLLPSGDSTFVGERGVRLSGGQKTRINLARAVYKNADFYLLDDPLSAVDAQVCKKLFQDCIKGYLGNKTVLLVTHQLQFLDQVNMIYVFDNGKIVTSGTYNQLKDYDSLKLNSKANKEVTKKTKKIDSKRKLSHLEIIEELNEDNEFGSVARQVYWKYLSAGGYYCATMVAIFLILVVLSISGGDYFLAFWVNFEETQPNNAPSYLLYIYSVFILLVIIFSLALTYIFIKFCMDASRNLHDKMFDTILFAPMSFFSTNPSGQILNRFTYDMGLIDKNLTLSALDTVTIAAQTIGIVILLCFVNYWILIPSLLLVVLFYYYKNIYLYTSRNLKRMEARCKTFHIYNVILYLF